MHKIKLIFITLFLFTTSIFASSFSLSIDKRLDGEADSRGGVFFDNGNIFVADHHDGLWKSTADGTSYGDTTGSDKQLHDVWKYNGNLFAVGKEGLFIYDADGNYLNSLTTVAGNALYIQNGFAYVTNESGGGVSIIDVSDITNPTVVSTILTGQNFLSIRGNALFGDTQSSGAGDAIYITDTSGNLYLFDDDKNGTLTLNNSIALFTEARRIFVHSDGIVYVNSGKGELAIVSADLTVKTTWTSTVSGSSTSPVGGGVFVTTIDAKRYAFITTSDKYTIYWLDVTDPANIILVDTYIDSSTYKYKFNDIWVENSKIYVPAHEGFLILDIVIPLTTAISGTIYNSSTSVGIANASIILYKDDGNGGPDVSDIFEDNTTTDASGNYSFSVVDGSYFVIVDSTTLHSDSNVSMEQTHGPEGAYCANGSGGTVLRGSAGVCYGGKEGDSADDITSITTAEHIAIVDLNGTAVNNINFGFNANVVSNVNDSGQGSLRQFIINANSIAGSNTMKFVPAVPKNMGTWWSISLLSGLPMITDSLMTFNGTAYDFYGGIRNPNGGFVGNGGMAVGMGNDVIEGTFDDPILGNFAKKELEIDINYQATYGLQVKQNGISNVTIKNIAIFGSEDGITAVNQASSDILVSEGASNIYISYNFVGLRADGSEPANKTKPNGITLIQNTNTISSFKIHHNYVGHIGSKGILTRGAAINGGDIYQNEVFHTDWFGAWNGDAITVESGSQNIDIFENYVHDNNGAGFDGWEAKGKILWKNNTSYRNGFNPDGNSNVVEMFGLRSMGDDNIVENNLIYGNSGAGVVVGMYENSAINALRTKITKNSIYNNGEISIDLDQTLGNGSTAIGDGLSVNTGSKNSSLQNEAMDFPVFTLSTIDAGNLHLEGYIGTAANQNIFANNKIEVYKVDFDGDSHGEGRWYLDTCDSDINGNFSCDITTSDIILGDFITATARDGNDNTSEFGENSEVTSIVATECYMMTDDDKTLYILTPQPGAVPLPSPVVVPLSRTLNGEGSAFRPSNGWIYGFDDKDFFSVDPTSGTIIRLVKDMISDRVVGAEFYFDGNETLYVLESESNTKLYAFDVENNWALKSGYPVSISGAQSGVDSIAIDPRTGNAYVMKDNDGAAAKIYTIDLTTGITTFTVQLSEMADAEGLAYGSDNRLYTEDEDKIGSGRRVYSIDLATGNLTPAAEFDGFSGDVEALSCNGGIELAEPEISIMDQEIIEGHTGVKMMHFIITANREVREDIVINYNTTDDTALAGVDYSASSGTVTIPKGSRNVTIDIPIIGDYDIEHPHELFFVDFTSANAIVINAPAVGKIINDDFVIEFRAIDQTATPDWNGTLSTQIVNKGFGVTVMAYNQTTSAPAADLNITQIKLGSDMLWNGPALTTDANGTVANIPIQVGRAIPNALLQIYGEYMGATYDSSSSDYFAVRPKNYKITVPTIPQKAGLNFTLKIEALDDLGATSQDYNETNSSFIVDFKELDPVNCIEGNFTLSNLQFFDGVAMQNINYSEVGRIEFNISEIAGNEFSKIDANDSSIINLEIDEDTSETMTFFPHKLKVLPWTLSKDPNYPALFYADMDSVSDMGAELNVRIQAVHSNGTTVTKNYKSGCFAKDTNLTIFFDLNSSDTQELVWKDMNELTHTGNKSGLVTGFSNFKFDINAANFINGETNASVKINFSRFVNQTKEPLSFKVTDVNATDSNGTTGNCLVTTQPELDFYYARLHAPTYTSIELDMNATVFYEVFCEKCDNSKFVLAGKKESADNVYWYILDNSVQAFNPNPESMNGATVNSVSNSVINLTAPRQPFIDKITYTPEEWLLYDKYNSTVATHYFNINFSSQAKSWSGKGKMGKTINADILQRSLQKMDW